MKYVTEFRDGDVAMRLSEAIHKAVTRSWSLMEVCGGQTHSIVKHGIQNLLPKEIRLIHGPGCPVCVTPLEVIDKAHLIARMPNAILASFGDMLRVPGSGTDLLTVKAQGADVRIVYSPLDALRIAQAEPKKEVVFLAVGFETTAPTTASAVLMAHRLGLSNFSLLVSHVRVPPALELLLSSPDNEIDGFLLAGHVCTVMGYEEYEPISERYRIPQVVTGFEPVDILEGILMCVKQLEAGDYRVENQYSRLVQRLGNPRAIAAINEVYEPEDQKWRGIGEIRLGGYAIRGKYSAFDANLKFGTHSYSVVESNECQSGLVMRGKIQPHQCPAFGVTCSPDRPLGAPMVSSEGACAAYFNYGMSSDLPVDSRPAKSNNTKLSQNIQSR